MVCLPVAKPTQGRSAIRVKQNLQELDGRAKLLRVIRRPVAVAYRLNHGPTVALPIRPKKGPSCSSFLPFLSRFPRCYDFVVTPDFSLYDFAEFRRSLDAGARTAARSVQWHTKLGEDAPNCFFRGLRLYRKALFPQVHDSTANRECGSREQVPQNLYSKPILVGAPRKPLSETLGEVSEERTIAFANPRSKFQADFEPKGFLNIGIRPFCVDVEGVEATCFNQFIVLGSGVRAPCGFDRRRPLLPISGRARRTLKLRFLFLHGQAAFAPASCTVYVSGLSGPIALKSSTSPGRTSPL